MQISIRKSRSEDFEEIVELCSKNKKGLGPYDNEEIEDLINENNFYVATLENKIVGVVGFYVEEREIVFLCVDKNYRKNGIARQLINTIKKDYKLDYVFAECKKGLENNYFYDKVGTMALEKKKRNYSLLVYKL